jgi:hypothetical protein
MFRLLAISIIISLFSITKASTNFNDINYIRKEFNLALEDENKATLLHSQLSNLKPASNTLQYAYLGATEALLAKYAFNPFSKMSYVNSALDKLNMAVALSKNDIEIRYMRFTVESNMPAFLGLNKHIDEDKNTIVNQLCRTKINRDNAEMYFVFANGIINSNFCNNQEKKLLLPVIDVCLKFKQNK